jgi:hypothetical protein
MEERQLFPTIIEKRYRTLRGGTPPGGAGRPVLLAVTFKTAYGELCNAGGDMLAGGDMGTSAKCVLSEGTVMREGVKERHQQD